jgi:hypothetical protein
MIKSLFPRASSAVLLSISAFTSSGNRSAISLLMYNSVAQDCITVANCITNYSALGLTNSTLIAA